MRNVEYNAVASGGLLFLVHQQQAELPGDVGSYQSPDQYYANSAWGTGAGSTVSDQAGSGHHLIPAGDDYGNSEKLGASDTSGQQPFSYWNASASHAEVRWFFTLCAPVLSLLCQHEMLSQMDFLLTSNELLI
jgi:hypothetical protein